MFKNGSVLNEYNKKITSVIVVIRKNNSRDTYIIYKLIFHLKP